MNTLTKLRALYRRVHDDTLKATHLLDTPELLAIARTAARLHHDMRQARGVTSFTTIVGDDIRPHDPELAQLETALTNLDL